MATCEWDLEACTETARYITKVDKGTSEEVMQLCQAHREEMDSRAETEEWTLEDIH